MSIQPGHRARRFFRSFVTVAPDQDDTDWAKSFLSDSEYSVFARMSAADRAHSIAVARAVEANLDRVGLSVHDADSRWVMAAALTHDVGKSVAGLGLYGRVVATLSQTVGGSSMAEVWADRRGITRKVGLYLQYPRLGAELLAIAGADDRVVAWASEHHEPEEDWSVPLEVGRLLVDADDGRISAQR